MIKTKILIVENEPVIATDIENSLLSLGYEVTSIANTAEQAIEVANADKPDIVLMDMQIKGERDGIETAEIIQTRFNIPVVFSTANLDEGKLEQAEITPLFGYILKPIQERELKVTIEMALFAGKMNAERRKTEELFRESEKKLTQTTRVLQTVLDTIPVRVFWKDKNLNYLGCNQLFAEDAGFKNPAELIGRDEDAMGWINEADKCRADDRQVLESRVKKLNYEEHRTTPEGNKIWLRTSKIPLEDSNGTILGIFGVYEEITERKQEEDNWKRSREIISRIVEFAEHGIIVYQENGLKFVNPHVCEVLGYQLAEIIDRPLSDFIHPDDLATVNKRHEGRISGEKLASITNFRVLTKKQEIKWVQNKPIVIDWEGKPAVLCFISDITEAKLAEQALRESEEKYRHLIDNSPDLIYRTDQTGKITFISQSVKGLSGFTDEEAIGMNLAAEVYLNPEERDHFLSQLSKNGYIQNFQAELKRKDGSTWWASTNAHLVKDVDGNILGVEGFTRDITKSRQTEDALRESEEIFKLIAGQSLMGISIFQDGVYQYVNETTARINEYSVEEMMGWQAEEFSKQIHPDDLDFVMNQFRKKQAGENEVTINYVFRGVTKSGKVKWIEQFSKSVTYKGRPANLVTVIDITERRQAEKELKDSEEKYRKVVMNAVEAICVLQDVKFRYFNPEAIRLFGYSEDELMQMSADDVVYPDDREQVITRRGQREKGEPLVGTYSHRIVTKDDNVRWVEIKSVNISWNNRPAVLVFLTDITEKKQSQELMIQTEKMMSVGGLAAGMAHELNNPLGGMLQGVQNIQRRFSPDLKSNHDPAEECGIDLHKLQAYLEKRGINTFLDGIKDSGRKASEIISNMLQFSRKSESQMAPIDLKKLVENTLELAGKDYDLKKKYDFRNIEITKEFDANLPLIACTETEIEQVLLNLLGNAAYAMANESQKGPHRITIRLLFDRNIARIEIEDNGPGMDEKVRQRIFEPFYTTKPVGEGTGLGLSVSYMIITNNHSGTMEVESEPGYGTKFIIQLPLE